MQLCHPSLLPPPRCHPTFYCCRCCAVHRHRRDHPHCTVHRRHRCHVVVTPCIVNAVAPSISVALPSCCRCANHRQRLRRCRCTVHPCPSPVLLRCRCRCRHCRGCCCPYFRHHHHPLLLISSLVDCCVVVRRPLSLPYAVMQCQRSRCRPLLPSIVIHRRHNCHSRSSRCRQTSTTATATICGQNQRAVTKERGKSITTGSVPTTAPW